MALLRANQISRNSRGFIVDIINHFILSYKDLFTLQTARCRAIPLTSKTRYGSRAVQEETGVRTEFVDYFVILSFIGLYDAIADIFQWKASLTKDQESK